MTSEHELIVDELTEMLEKYKSPTFHIVINALIGAIMNEQDIVLAKETQKIILNILLPDLQRQQEIRAAFNN